MEVREPSAKYLARPAYKQTEVGSIPEDWDVKQLGDLQPFVTSGSRGWAAFYSEFGSPFIRITNLSRECIYPDLSDLRFVRIPSSNSEGFRTQLKDGDVLISITADIGIVGYVTKQMPKPAYINQHIALVRFDATQTCPRYVSYFLAAERTQKLFRALTDSGAKAGMNLATVKQIKAALPPTVSEQQAIAEALSDADALIDSLAQLIAKKRQIKQGAMQELLTGQKRLPGFVKEWEKVTLGDLATFIKGKGLPKGELDPFGITPCIHYGELFTQYSETISEVISRTNATGSYVRSISNDVAMPTSDVTPTGLAKASCLTMGGVILGGDILIIRIEADRVCGSFLSYVIRHGEEQVLQLVTGSTVFHLYAADMRRFVFVVPDIHEQHAIVSILADMDAELAALEAKLAKARDLKQGMMQELLTGRIRLV